MGPANELCWHDHDVAAKGVRERRFDVHRHERVVPAMLWTPATGTGPRPLVLIGHGSAQTKSTLYVTALARTLVRHYDVAALAIDGPVHGDRRADGGPDPSVMFVEFAHLWQSDAAMTDDMVADWRATLDAVWALPDIDGGPVGYWGLSMGTIIGLPLVAAEPRITVAVLGLMGVIGPSAERLAADAATISCPVLFLVQWDDDLFPRDACFALFSTLGTKDKRLHANPGAHGAVPSDEFLATADFLAHHLRP
ncbi:MAG TPA: hypothetical protein VMV14_09405 [Acidimicrobiales bacterium]|nr:hypothetical protein [Acidimicrobiales bacterium]